MAKVRSVSRRGPRKDLQLPLMVEQDEDGFYAIECPILAGCYSQGKTLDEALENIQEVIALLAEEKDARTLLESFKPRHVSLHTISIRLA